VAKQLRVVYAHKFDFAWDYKYAVSDDTVELAFPVSADALRRVELAGEDDGDDDDYHRAGPLPLEVVVRMSYKSAASYSSNGFRQLMVTAHVVGHHARLSTALAAKAVAAANTASGLGGCGTPNLPDDTVDAEEEKDTVVLKLDRDFPGNWDRETVTATEAIELVGGLLGLALRPTTSDAPQAADTNGGGPPGSGFHGGHNPDPAMESTPPFARAVLAFLAETARMATWDAEEGTFPVPSALYHKWEEEEINGDHKEEDTNKTAEHESQLAHEIDVLCDWHPFEDFF
jgi:hypothetical protein